MGARTCTLSTLISPTLQGLEVHGDAAEQASGRGGRGGVRLTDILHPTAILSALQDVEGLPGPSLR
jgi:hypothetical protein